MTDRSLLSLVMVLDDEEAALQTIESAKPYIDQFTIIKTSASDRNGEEPISKVLLEDVPGRFIYEPSLSRTAAHSRALELASKTSVFTLVLNPGELLEGGEVLREFCEQASNQDQPGTYAIETKWKLGLGLALNRLAKGEAPWQLDPTGHELRFGSVSKALMQISGVSIRNNESLENTDSVNRLCSSLLSLFANDRMRLEEPRNVFDLAQILERMGRHQEAMLQYRRRIELGGPDEELYASKFGLACCAKAAGSAWPEVQQLFLDAYALEPYRAEPLYAISSHWMECGNHPLGFLFAHRAMQLRQPAPENWEVNEAIYKFGAADQVGVSAHRLGEIDAGESAVGKALRHLPNEAHLAHNLTVYVQSRFFVSEDSLTSDEVTFLISQAREVLSGIRNVWTFVHVGGNCSQATVALGAAARAVEPRSRLYTFVPQSESDLGLGETALDKIQLVTLRNNLENTVRCVNDRFEMANWDKTISLLFIDGLDEYREVEKAFRCFMDFVVPGGRIVFHTHADGSGARRFVNELMDSGACRQIASAGSLIALERLPQGHRRWSKKSKCSLKVALLVFHDGRNDYLSATLASLAHNINLPEDTYRILIDDNPKDRDVSFLKKIQKEHKIDDLILNETNLGINATIHEAWKHVPKGIQFIYHQENDFVYNCPVDVNRMAAPLRHKHIAQVALLRQPWYTSEIEPDGIYESAPKGTFVDAVVSGINVTLHRLYFTHNPCIYRRGIIDLALEAYRGEYSFRDSLIQKNPQICFAYYGGLRDGPRVTHIGTHKPSHLLGLV